MPRVAVEDEQGVVYMLLEVAVVVRAFLITVGGVVRGVEVQKHFIWRALLLPLLQIELEEDLGYLVARASGGRILHPTDGRLARSSPLSGKEPQESLNRGSWRKVFESFFSS